MKTTIPDHKEHIKLAASFRSMQRLFFDFARTIWDRFPKSHRVSLQVDKLAKQMAELKHRLDGEYHRVTSDAEFNKAGHIYYNERERPIATVLEDWVYCLDCNDPRFREPEKNELIIGIYRNEDGLSPVLLWADPASLSAKLELLVVRVYEGRQDIREDLDALLAANPGALASVQTTRAILAWDKASRLDGPLVVLADAKGFLGRLAAATAPGPDNLRQARVHALSYRASLNEDVNAEIMELLGTVKGTLAQAHAEILYNAFKPVTAGNAQLSAFYDMLLRAVEAKPASAAFLRKILDQKLKLQ